MSKHFTIRGRLTDSQLHRRLVLHREECLVIRYPSAPRECGLLRRAMIDAIVSHRPITVTGFKTLIPSRLIRATDPRQIAGDLDEVLEIVRYST